MAQRDAPDRPDPSSEPPADSGRTTPEKITTAISLLLIVLLAGAILYEGYWKGQADPATLEVTVRTDQIDQRGGSYYVPVEIHNAGDQTVEEVTVSIDVIDGENVVQEAETVIATLGEAETVTAVVVLTEDPTGLTIEAGVVTYQIAES
ncbi:MAG TPA: hypothetical protein VFV93_02955 [Thermomicrobiales bacterium]|nr:hypothetical protein [Thermomicrobiales bacterium]